MNGFVRLMPVAAALGVMVPGPARALDDATAASVLAYANQQLAATAARVPPQEAPSTTAADGSWHTVANDDPVNWIQGFFAGSNWVLYDLTRDPLAKARAAQWTRALEAQKTNTQTHDLGFKMYLSFGHAYRTTGDPYYKDVLLTAAASLAFRFDSTVGAVICCDWNPAWHRPTVVDTMMNLELLLWGAQNGGPATWRGMAVSHALKTLADMVRSDGSTYHVVDYSAAGDILSRGTLQGYADSSTWTRGQAWAIYGYTMLYRYTADARMLAAARKVTDYYLRRLGADPIPNWDFDAPAQQKDSSAAAAVASALFELSGFVPDPDRQRYLQAATSMLDALASSRYLAQGTPSRSILLHGVGNLPAGQAIDVGLVYGDYYFLEALARRPPASVTPPDAGPNDAGPEDAGAIDAGTGSNDAGSIDAGSPDGGPSIADAGAPPDAGVVDLPADAGVPDAGVGAVPPVATPPPPKAATGGCATTGDAGFLAGLVIGFALFLRRRRLQPLLPRYAG